MKTESRFGKKVREFRVDRGGSQEQLAEIAGIATRQVQRVEKDQTRDGETLQAIAAAFDVTVRTCVRTIGSPNRILLKH